MTKLLERGLRGTMPDQSYFAVLSKFAEETKTEMLARGQSKKLDEEPYANFPTSVKRSTFTATFTSFSASAFTAASVDPAITLIKLAVDLKSIPLLSQVAHKCGEVAILRTSSSDFLLPLAEKIMSLQLTQPAAFALSTDPFLRPVLQLLLAIYKWTSELYVGVAPPANFSLKLPKVGCGSGACDGCRRLDNFFDNGDMPVFTY